ncbi:MAG TPA: bifunctional shikimate kinase/3-dehydroquinate synthase, partial [Actinomycetota bacterium]|nr:bifunctional shikimate kinase/3-dehydroquinate synthase [Actinomycetota bacterium]
MAAGLRRSFLPAPSLGPGRPRLVITGFMGTGKTAAGRAAAKALRLPFVDLDAMAEKVAGRTVAQIFATSGEDAFRQLERELLEDAARLSGVVIATGGGAVLHEPEFARLAEGAVVAVLSADRDEVLRRLGDGDRRPLLGADPAGAVDRLLEARADRYAAAGPTLDTSSMTVTEVATFLVQRYREAADPRSVTLPVHGPEGRYPVIVRPHILQRVGELLHRIRPEATRAAIVVDADVMTPWGRKVTASVAETGVDAGTPIVLPAGEEGKTAAAVTDLWQRLRDRRLSREDVVVAVGGGGTLDVAGFAAATYARGVPLVNVPTTLLSMVDAGLGGKVGIDHAGVKNLVGAFHHPAAVVADPLVLETLPPRALRAGLGECVKAAVAASPMVLDVLEALPLLDHLLTYVGWIAEQAIRVKAAYVRDDPFDRGLRHALNLGH